jgi:hypothetical protein
MAIPPLTFLPDVLLEVRFRFLRARLFGCRNTCARMYVLIGLVAATSADAAPRPVSPRPAKPVGAVPLSVFGARAASAGSS